MSFWHRSCILFRKYGVAFEAVAVIQGIETLVSFADGFSPSDAAVDIPFLLRTLPLIGLRDATGFARNCRYFSRGSSGFTLALWIEVLDILGYAFPLVPPPIQPVFPLSFFT
jgi:hypothetical protein